MIQDCSGHADNFAAVRSNLLISVATSGLDASGAHLEPWLVVPFFPKDFICRSHTPESLCKVNQHVVNEGNWDYFKRNKALKQVQSIFI